MKRESRKGEVREGKERAGKKREENGGQIRMNGNGRLIRNKTNCIYKHNSVHV